MGVIKPKTKALTALTCAAIALPGVNVVAAVPATRAEGNIQYGHYQEGDKRMKVQVYHADGLVPLTDRLEFSFSYDRDTYSGASPGWNVPETMTKQAYNQGGTGDKYLDVISAASAVSAQTLTGDGLQNFNIWKDVKNASGDSVQAYRALLDKLVPSDTKTLQRFQNQPLETRTQPVLGLKYHFDDTTVALSGGISDEPDFLSNFGSINITQELNDKATTMSAGYSATGNSIFRNGGHSHTPPGVGLGHIHPADCSISPCTNYPELDADSFFHGFNLGFTQVLGKNSLFKAVADYTHQSGYLSNPYKSVYVKGEITPQEYVYLSEQGAGSVVDWRSISQLEIVGAELFRENRPGNRNQFSFSTGLNQHIPSIDASLHLDYRYYRDDWNIDSHTFELKWFQSLPYGLSVTPSVRYYSQSQADFFAPYFLSTSPDGHYSSDFRLSAFGSLNGGVILGKQIAKGIKLEAGVEYYTHEADLKLGGKDSGDYADYSYYLVHGGLNVDLSAPASLFGGGGGGAHDHHHMHHGNQPPAGVMFAHMMSQTNDVMVGYRYMNSGQAGDMLRGNRKVSDAELAQGAELLLDKPGAALTSEQLASLTDACPGYGSSKIKKYIGFGCLVKPHYMHMGMHMLDVMFAPTDWLNLMVMPQLMDMDMKMSGDLRAPLYTANGSFTEKHSSSDAKSLYSGMRHTVFDLGDTTLMALVKLFDSPNHHVHLGIGASAPTGSVSAVHTELSTVVVGNQQYDVKIKVLQDFGMQPGSGTWDLKPNLTYTGQMNELFWGAQFSAVKRLQDRNKSGYALGDVYQSTTWGGYNLLPWLSASVRGVYTQQNQLKGDIYQVEAKAIPGGETHQIAHSTVSTVDYPQNSGGHYWDVGLGVNMTVPDGAFAGHNFAFEWLQPVKDHVNGYQLERNSAFTATWSYMF